MTGLIVALDFNAENKALALVDQLDPQQCNLKVGLESFCLFGPSFVKKLVDKHFKVFLDLKLHDIPSTVAKACKACADLGVWMTNVHASGGPKMLEAAKVALEEYGKQRPLLIAVTVLTSMNQEDLNSLSPNTAIADRVLDLAKLAKQANLDGVVSSAEEARIIKKTCSSPFLVVTPGIRLAGDEKNDQIRVMTPMRAKNAGSDFLVVGRPITASLKPMQVVNEILATLGQ